MEFKVNEDFVDVQLTFSGSPAGYFAIGFSESGFMSGSNAIIVTSSKVQRYFLASYSDVNPLDDEHQDLTNQQVTFEDGVTKAQFTIPISATAAPEFVSQLLPKDDAMANLIYAYGSIGGDGKPTYHTFSQRGGPVRVQFLDGATAAPALSATATPTTAAAPATTSVTFDDKLSMTVQVDSLSANIQLHYAANPEDTYFAIGFSTSEGSMAGSNAIVVSSSKVHRYFLGSRSAADVNLLDDEQQDLTNQQVTFEDGVTIAQFTMPLSERSTRRLSAGRSLLSVDDVANMIYAYGPTRADGQPTRHSTRGGPVAVRFSEAGDTGTSVAGGWLFSRRQILILSHGLMMVFAWIILSPHAVLAAIGFKSNWNPGVWFRVHRNLQMTVILVTLISGGIAIYFTGGIKFNYSIATIGSHQTIGITLLALGLVQAVVGIFRPHATAPGAQPSKGRVIWEYAHKYLGRSMLMLAFANCWLGVYSPAVISHPELFAICFWCLTASFFLLGFSTVYTLYTRCTYTATLAVVNVPALQQRSETDPVLDNLEHGKSLPEVQV